MAKICDNKSVGLIYAFWNHFVAIKRWKHPRAYALPAGHLDGDDFLTGLIRESREEVGLDLKPEQLALAYRGTIRNPCRRDGGDYHEWEAYRLVGVPPSTEVNAGSDAKEVLVADQFQLKKWAERTEYFMKKYSTPWQEVEKLTVGIFGRNPSGEDTDPEWEAEMGLEPVWYYILRECGYFNWNPPVVGRVVNN